MPGKEGLRLAVLIDSDNTSAKWAKQILAELAKYGTLTVKRAYGDWTTQNLVGWKPELHQHAIQPVQQFAYTVGKNSTDSALIIDAMDLLYSGNLDGFCLVSSDSDFTRLATRLREAGKTVYGLGWRKTPTAFISACDKFTFLEVLSEHPLDGTDDSPPPDRQEAQESVRTSNAAVTPFVPKLLDVREILAPAITGTSKESGWSSLSSVGSYIGKNHASFDPRNYGFTRLSELVRTLPYVEVKEVPDTNNFIVLWVRLKSSKAGGRARSATAKRGVS
ncbi:MAG: NYN domain-containing protein [Actinomycetota bacterium]|nr:NYN domain-containing protein [Actinomycetota bacterium]